jgi:diguanylate cyclase (GGDEF)-like protein
LSRQSRRLILGAVALLLATMLAVCFAIWNFRTVTLESARHNVNVLGSAISEQTARSVQSVDVVLLNTMNDIAADRIETTAQFRAMLGTQTEHDNLVQEGRGLPQANAFTIIDATGQLVNFSRRWPIPATDLSDRDYFKYLSTHDFPGAFISRPLQNRGDGTWTVYVVRRVDGPHGAFLGLLLGAIDLNYYKGFYQSLAAGNGISIMLIHRDGGVLACFPDRCPVGQKLFPAGSPWYGIAATGSTGLFDDQGLFEPGEHLVSVHALTDYPLVVNVCISRWLALADWRHEAWLALGGTLSGVLAVLLFMRALANQLQRLERSEARLAQRNRALIESEEKLQYLAHHDDLTKLTNRRMFRKLLERAIRISDESNRRLAVIYLDLDRFKMVNDIMGHGIGDKLLVAFAQRLHGAVREVDTIARTGGDEFAIIQPVIGQAVEAETLARNLLQIMKEPFMIDGAECRIGVSIGIAHYPDQARNASDLLRNADTALYRAKEEGRGSYFVFDAVTDVRQQELFALEQELKAALELGQFTLDYQPIVASGSGRVSACETLIRWQHPERGLVPPGDFIELAEKLRLIVPIGYWVLETACAEAMRWPADVGVAINLSPVQFNDDNLVAKLADVFMRTKLPPHRLILEVTEGVLLENTANVLGVMACLRQLGVRFNLDDFGTGHSGLAYLRTFPFDGIKIDKVFVQDMVEQPEARAIVTALLTVATALGLDVIGEGVETPEQLRVLRELGCGYVQGYLTGRPGPASALPAVFEAYRLSSELTHRKQGQGAPPLGTPPRPEALEPISGQ